MTQHEFYLKAILAMASNPKYVEMVKADDDPNITFPSLLDEIILEDADALLTQVQKTWPESFDIKGLEDIHDQLEEIASSGLAVEAHCLVEGA